MKREVLVVIAVLLGACGGQGGEDGYSSLMNTEEEPPGENCEYGGQSIQMGLDTDRDGVLSADEVQDTVYLCDGAGNVSQPAAAMVNVVDEAPGSTCAAGGVLIEWGHDSDANSELDSSEVEGQTYICNGENGQDGEDGVNGQDGEDGVNGQDGEDGQDGSPGSLVAVVPVEEGDDCSSGGQAIQIGSDVNQDGTLQPDEVTSTTYVCNGEGGGSNHVSLIVQMPESSGDNCSAGGTRVDSGIDLNDNGALDEDEISATTYVCNGVSSLIRVTSESAGDNCEFGGTRVDVGMDDGATEGHAGDGTLEEDEVDDTFFLCDDAPPLAGFLMKAADEDYFAFPEMPGVTAQGAWSIVEAVQLPESPQNGWHFFRGKAWEDHNGDAAIGVNLGATPPDVHAWVYSNGWVNVIWEDSDLTELSAGRTITICFQYNATSQMLELWVNGAKRTEVALSSSPDDSSNSNPLYFGGQMVDPSHNEGNLYSEADIVMIHQAWLTRTLSEGEIAGYDGTNFTLDGSTVFATDIREDLSGQMDFYDQVSGTYAVMGNTPEYVILE